MPHTYTSTPSGERATGHLNWGSELLDTAASGWDWTWASWSWIEYGCTMPLRWALFFIVTECVANGHNKSRFFSETSLHKILFLAVIIFNLLKFFYLALPIRCVDNLYWKRIGIVITFQLLLHFHILSSTLIKSLK